MMHYIINYMDDCNGDQVGDLDRVREDMCASCLNVCGRGWKDAFCEGARGIVTCSGTHRPMDSKIKAREMSSTLKTAKYRLLPVGTPHPQMDNIVNLFVMMDTNQDGVLTKKEVMKALYFRPDVADLIQKIDALKILLKPHMFETAFMEKEFLRGKHELDFDEFAEFVVGILQGDWESNYNLPAEMPLPTTNEETKAATSVQTVFRGRRARQKTERIKQDLEEQRAAAKVQARVRGRQTRQFVNKLTETQRIEHKAATKLQALIRGRRQRKRIGLGSTMHKEWLQMMADKKCSISIDMAHLHLVVKYMALKGHVRDHDMENALEVAGAGMRLSYSSYAAFFSKHKDRLDPKKPRVDWQTQTRITRVELNRHRAIDFFRMLKRRLAAGWDFEVAQMEFDSNKAKNAYSISYEKKYQKEIIKTTLKKSSERHLQHTLKLQRSHSKHMEEMRRKAVEKKTLREGAWNAADKRRRERYARHKPYVPRPCGVAKKACSPKYSISENFNWKPFRFKEDRVEDCILELCKCLQRIDGDLLKTVNVIATKHELKVDDIPELVFKAFDRTFQWNKDTIETYQAELKTLYPSRPTQKILLDHLAYKYFSVEAEQTGSEESRTQGYKRSLADLISTGIVTKRHANSWIVHQKNPNSSKREEKEELPIYTDDEVLFPGPPRMTPLDMAAFAARGTTVSAIKSIPLREDEIAGKKGESAHRSPSSLPENKDSVWHSPKFDRPKTPLYPDWSPHKGDTLDHVLFSRRMSLVELPQVSSGGKSWKTEEIEQVKLLKHSASARHSSSSDALKVYGRRSTSPKYPVSPKGSPKSRKSPRKQRNEEQSNETLATPLLAVVPTMKLPTDKFKRKVSPGQDADADADLVSHP